MKNNISRTCPSLLLFVWQCPKRKCVLSICDIIQLFHTFLGDSQNCQPRPIVHHVVHSTKGLIVLTVAQKGMIQMFYYPTHILKEVFF